MLIGNTYEKRSVEFPETSVLKWQSRKTSTTVRHHSERALFHSSVTFLISICVSSVSEKHVTSLQGNAPSYRFIICVFSLPLELLETFHPTIIWIISCDLPACSRWMDPTFPPSPLVCDSRSGRTSLQRWWGGVSLSNGGQLCCSLVWTPNLLLRFCTIVGKPSFCSVPAKRTKLRVAAHIQQHVARRAVIITRRRLFVDLVWFLDYALHQEFLFSSFLKHP